MFDTTQVSFTLTEQGGEQRAWNVEKELVDRIHDGNPLADSFGHPAVWHFCSLLTPSPRRAIFRLVGLGTMAVGGDWPRENAQVHKLAEAVKQTLLPKLENAPDADKVLRASFTNPTGPLQWLVLAGRCQAGDVDAAAPAILEYKLPGKLVAGGEVVVTAQLHPEKGANGRRSFWWLSSRTPRH